MEPGEVEEGTRRAEMRKRLYLCGLLLLGLMPGQLWSADAGSEKCLGRESYVIDLYRNRTEKFDRFTIRARWSIDNDGNGFIVLRSNPELFNGTFIAKNETSMLPMKHCVKKRR